MGCLPRLPRSRKFSRRSPIKAIRVAAFSICGRSGDQERIRHGGHEKKEKEKEKDCTEGCVRKYGWDEIQKMTINFSQVIGSGGFSTVYLADHFPRSTSRAIKIQGAGNNLHQLFKQELEILLRLRHENVVKLLGYCDDQEEGALVFEYVPNGTLQDKLHGKRGERVLSWRRRMTIAFQLAQALEYLHEKCPLQIVHGDIKASNILLDENLNCKLCDFGSAKMGFSSTITPSSRISRKQVMIGSPGYTDPHYMRTGIPSKKNDVYSYGVIILELVTGMEAFSEKKCRPLVSIMGPLLRDIAAGGNDEAMKVAKMVDLRLGGDFDLKEAKVMLSNAALCIGQSPSFRPSITQVLQAMKESVPSVSFLSNSEKDLPTSCNKRSDLLLPSLLFV